MKNKLLFSVVILIYLIIPILILFNDNLCNYKFYILTIIGSLLFLIFKIMKIKGEYLGITKKNAINSIKRNSWLIIIFVVAIIIIYLSGMSKYTPNESIWFYPFYIFISVPIQEFLYRGVFGYFNEILIKNRIVMIILSSFLYSFVHIIYRDFFTCLLTFIIGTIWYSLYKKDNNLLGVILSHIVLGLLTIVLGIVN